MVVRFRIIQVVLIITLISLYIVAADSTVDNCYDEYRKYLKQIINMKNHDKFLSCIIDGMKRESIVKRFSAETRNNTDQLIKQFNIFFVNFEDSCRDVRSEKIVEDKSMSNATDSPDSFFETVTWIVLAVVGSISLLTGAIVMCIRNRQIRLRRNEI